jgi:FkbM family methyltransferase
MLRPFLLNYYIRGLHRAATMVRVAYARDRVRDSGLGARIRFDLREPNECFSFFYFADDLWIRTWKKYLAPGDAFIDVGANVGFYCTHIAKFVGASGRVVGIEPNSAMVARLEESVRENALDNLSFVNAAASDFEGDAVLLVGSDHGLTRLHTGDRLPTGIEVVHEKSVPVISLDGLAARLHGRPLRGIKLDIEGHEYRALRGGQSLLAQFRPLVQMEFNPTHMRQYGIEPSDIRGFFEALDYVFYATEQPDSFCFHKSAIRLKRYVPGSEQWSASDLWACPSESEGALLTAWQSATLP